MWKIHETNSSSYCQHETGNLKDDMRLGPAVRSTERAEGGRSEGIGIASLTKASRYRRSHLLPIAVWTCPAAQRTSDKRSVTPAAGLWRTASVLARITCGRPNCHRRAFVICPLSCKMGSFTNEARIETNGLRSIQRQGFDKLWNRATAQIGVFRLVRARRGG